MISSTLKKILPNHPVRMRIWRGPFRGARVMMNPRNSLRKIFGLYEHELNGWIDAALRRVSRVVDVGANDGYFTFGCAAAFRRLGKGGEIFAFEPLDQHFQTLQQSAGFQTSDVQFTFEQSLVGREVQPGVTTLDRVQWKTGDPGGRKGALVKIDVEGAEMEVLAGATSWLNPSNCFLIEVHKKPFIEGITRLFAGKGLALEQVNQRPLALIGREGRAEENWWLVSRLDSGR
jgi:hypothetical protein